jgi:hypothetical protein
MHKWRMEAVKDSCDLQPRKVATTTQDSCDHSGQLRLQPRTVATTTQDSCDHPWTVATYNPGKLRLHPRTVATTSGQLRLQPRTVVTTTRDSCDLFLPFAHFEWVGEGVGDGSVAVQGDNAQVEDGGRGGQLRLQPRTFATTPGVATYSYLSLILSG